MPGRYVLLESYSHDGLTNFEFDVNKPYRCCLLCGVVFQSPVDRSADSNHRYPSMLEAFSAERERSEWANQHAKLHTEKEHADFNKSGRFCTPEAAMKLVPLGIAPVSDIVLSAEHEHAGAVAPRTPIEDAEDHIVRTRR